EMTLGSGRSPAPDHATTPMSNDRSLSTESSSITTDPLNSTSAPPAKPAWLQTTTDAAASGHTQVDALAADRAIPLPDGGATGVTVAAMPSENPSSMRTWSDGPP